MTWITGTATDYLDLLAQIKTNAEANNWVTDRYVTAGETLPHVAELIMHGPGFGQDLAVYAGIRAYEDVTDNIYAFEGRGMTSYLASEIFEFQPGVSPPVYTGLWDATITFWLSISDRRILLIAKCSNTYHSMYLGFITPFTDPVEYPYPMYVAGDSPVPVAFGNIDFLTRSVAFPSYQGAFLRSATGVWNTVSMYGIYGYPNNLTSYGASMFTIYPYHTAYSPQDGIDLSIPVTNQSDWTTPTLAKFDLTDGQAGALPTMPCYIQAMFDKGGFIGILEGIYWIPGNTLSAEQEITATDGTYKVFIAISRSVEQPSQYYLVKEA